MKAKFKVGQVVQVKILAAHNKPPFRQIAGRFFDTRSEDFSVTSQRWVYRIEGDAGEWGEKELRSQTKREAGR